MGRIVCSITDREDSVGCTDLPHVDEILGQGNTLRVATDGDGPVKVGWGISVLTVGDSDHCSTNLSESER